MRGLFSKGVVEVRGSKLQIRCRLILLISEHPIQRGIRKECWHRIPGNRNRLPGNLDPLQKTAVSGGKTKKKLPKFFLRLRDTYKKYILQKKLGQNGHSSPQQWSEQSTDAYMGLPPPTR